MGILQYIIGSIILVLAVLLIFLISKQQGKRRGLENVISGQSSSNSYLNKTEAAKKGKRFEKWTLYCAIAFGVLVIALYTVTAIADNLEKTRAEESKAAAASQAAGATSSLPSNVSIGTSSSATESKEESKEEVKEESKEESSPADEQ